MAAFDDIIGHENPKAFFSGIQATQRIASGFQLHGDSGRGKLLFAEAFVQRLFCADGTGCGQCPACIRYRAGSHGDIEIVRLVDGKTRISIEQLRNLREWFHRAPYEADRRCAIINDAHLMTEEAQNSLLKLLEEPPAHGILILVTENPQGLLDTIHSRLQAVYFGPLTEADVAKIIRGQVEASEEEIQRAASLANGSPGQALSLVGDETSAMIQEAAERLFDLKTLPFGYSEMVSGGRVTGADARAKVNRILEVAMNLVSQQIAATVNEDGGKPPIPALAPWPVEVLGEAQELLMDSVGAIRSNTSPRSVVESLKIRMHRIIGRARRAQKSVGGGR